ncbi:MAG: cation-translocating P-type ATPase [Dyadobacter sp.]|uniref:cation-translocating P-type ATPase n=1 Tax=Dyadobacter sp. TaxID=1914288 RepID=UPI001B23848A|nr:cation-translocating P-type ATPase [Dyadobacter sp.]MBO9611798.1 cation-translocating P-type ATPase [Dyadobacter sp.]
MHDQPLYIGLSSSQAEASRQQHGPNLLEKQKLSGPLSTLKALAAEPMLLLLVAAAAIYFLMGSTQEAVIMLVAIALVAAISIVQEGRTRRALISLENFTSPAYRVLRDQSWTSLKSEALVTGDVVELVEGYLVPADGIILSADDFSVNESILTGESMPVYKLANDPSEKLFAGTQVTSGQAICRITAVGNGTRLAEIGSSIASIQPAKSALQIQIGRLVRDMAMVGGVIFIAVWAIRFIRSGDLPGSLLGALTLAMSILPEEIPVALATFMALGAYRLMKQGIVVKRMETVEALGSATVICTDKTGTLTENTMSLSGMFVLDGRELITDFSSLPPNAVQLLYHAALASEINPFDPMEAELHRVFEAKSSNRLSAYNGLTMLLGYPLEGKPPMMTHIWQNKDDQHIIAVKGAPEALINASPLSPEDRAALLSAIDRFTSNGFRVLAVGKSDFQGTDFPENQLSLPFQTLGLVAFYDPPKAGMAQVLDAFYQAGVQVKILTGDNPVTTAYIARQIGLRHADSVTTGEQIMALDDEGLLKEVGKATIFARMFPQAKLRVIRALKARGEIVAMTGDGVNDGPALKAADIGIAMGRKGTEIARQASALILLNDDLGGMVTAIESGRRIYVNLRNAIRYIVAIHTPLILLVFLPLALNWVYPVIFDPVHIIFFELIMGPTCSVVYENEPARKGLLKEKPRPVTARLFGLRELTGSLLQGATIAAFLVLVYFVGVKSGQSENATRAMIFIGMISANIALTVTNRSRGALVSLFQQRNKLVFYALAMTIVLTVLIFRIPSVAELFRLSAIDSPKMLFSAGCGLVSVLVFEISKQLARILRKSGSPG